MPEEVVSFIMRYGYLAIFILVFLQETGMPNPFPNELLLIFSGYLSSIGVLFFPFVIIAAVCADFTGTNILYFVFYKTGSYIMVKKPRWFPLSTVMIEKLKSKINSGGKISIVVLRLTPFTRGYVSVIAGLLQIKHKVFIPIALITAITWASVYVTVGYFTGPFWKTINQNIEGFKYFMLAFVIGGLFILFIVCKSKKDVKNISGNITSSPSE